MKAPNVLRVRRLPRFWSWLTVVFHESHLKGPFPPVGAEIDSCAELAVGACRVSCRRECFITRYLFVTTACSA